MNDLDNEILFMRSLMAAEYWHDYNRDDYTVTDEDGDEMDNPGGLNDHDWYHQICFETEQRMFLYPPRYYIANWNII